MFWNRCVSLGSSMRRLSADQYHLSHLRLEGVISWSIPPAKSLWWPTIILLRRWGMLMQRHQKPSNRISLAPKAIRARWKAQHKPVGQPGGTCRRRGEICSRLRSYRPYTNQCRRQCKAECNSMSTNIAAGSKITEMRVISIRQDKSKLSSWSSRSLAVRSLGWQASRFQAK